MTYICIYLYLQKQLTAHGPSRSSHGFSSWYLAWGCVCSEPPLLFQLSLVHFLGLSVFILCLGHVFRPLKTHFTLAGDTSNQSSRKPPGQMTAARDVYQQESESQNLFPILKLSSSLEVLS